MQAIQRSALCVLGAALLVLTSHATVRAHDIPDEIVLQTYLKPQGGRLQMLLRIPLIAITDANLPKDGPGYLALRYVDPALREAANQIANGIVLTEGSDRLANYELAYARISLPSDRSFNTYEGALARMRGPGLPENTQVYYNQGFLDLELGFPIRSEQSDFAVRILFGRGLAQRTATYINFVRPDGAVREFRLHNDASLVRLDPRAHQAAWAFLTIGFFRLLDSLDHLLFVVVLAIPYRRVRDLVVAITVFAMAHSLTLALSAAGIVPMGNWFPATIGMLIAASIVYVAIENVIGWKMRPRLIATFAFGLIHGFGFAFALRDALQFAGSHSVVALLSFTVGLELGIVIILAIAVPLLTLFFAQIAAERVGTIVLSAIVGHSGWHWMAERLPLVQAADWPPFDIPLALVVVRWLLALTVAGAGIWLVSGLLRRQPDAPEAHEKSIVDGP
jgi:hypothetical protein